MNFKTCCMGFCNNIVTHSNIRNPKGALQCLDCKEKFKDVKKGPTGNIITWARGAVYRAAERKRFEVQITYEDILYVWPEDNKCPIMGTKFKSTKGEYVKNRKTSPSLDRINPDEGYVLGNIQVISGLANSMKANATEEQIKRFCKYYENSSRNT